MVKLNEKLLARYYDGELSPKKDRQVEQLLRQSPEHQESLRKMTQIGDLLRMANEETVDRVSFEGFAQQVEAGIAEERASRLSEKVKVWLQEFGTYRKPIWGPSAVLVASAIAVLLILPLTTSRPGEPETPAIAQNGTWMASDEASRAGSTIESVTFDDTDKSGQDKFEVSKVDGQNGSIGVVWIVD